MRRLVVSVSCLVTLALSTTVHPQPSGPSPTMVVLGGELTRADKGTYQEHPFTVPAGVTRIDFEFTHSHKDAGTQLEVGLFDPMRFRGTSRFSKSRFFIAEGHATPSYSTGPLLAGTWRVSLGVPAIGADTRATWQVRIRLSFAADTRPGVPTPLRAGPAWFTGDFHAHTVHSDAFDCQDGPEAVKRGCQPWEVVEAARAQRLDFLAITDHNTTSHHAEMATLQEGSPDLLLIRGQELTTFRGHANVYGTSAFIDFRLGFQGRHMGHVIDDVERAGGVLSINHPGRETGDRCTGCGWDAPATPWAKVPVLEVVNGPTVEGPTAGLGFWRQRLNEGHRIIGIGGSDDHAARSSRSRIGAPATVVFASDLSETGILEGVRAGRAYIRTRGTPGLAVDIAVTASGRETSMGGVVTLSEATMVELRIDTQSALGQRAEVVRNGEVVASILIDAAAVRHSLRLAPGQWVNVQLRDDNGLSAISNPVFVRPPQLRPATAASGPGTTRPSPARTPATTG
mgnify:CR=1 FL=1